MIKLLPIFLISILFLTACSSTQTLTQCPKFKEKQSKKYFTKAVYKKKNKRNKIQPYKETVVQKQARKRANKIERLTQKVVKRLDSKKVKEKIEQLPQEQIEQLYTVLNQLKQSNLQEEASTKAIFDFTKDKLVKTNPKLSDLSTIQNRELANLKIPQNIRTLKKQPIQQLPEDETTVFKQTHGLAITALVMGILGLLFGPLPFGILAIVFGRIAKREIAEEPDKWEGEGMATTGVVLGIVGLALFVIVVGFSLAFLFAL